MPWGWECRAKLIKQNVLKPTTKRGLVSGEAATPSPFQYDPPQIYCGNGFSNIKRAPAYSFGHMTPASFNKPAATKNAKMFNICGFTKKGTYKIKGSLVTPQIGVPGDNTRKPGPAAYAPRLSIQTKRPPAFSLRPPSKPTYQPWDMWTPPPNMYCPPMLKREAPKYSVGPVYRELKQAETPGPGEHDPIFNFVKPSRPAFSFGAPFRRLSRPKSPAPNAYCEKKFKQVKNTIPAISFGIRHTPYLGVHDEHLVPTNLNSTVGKI